MSIRFPLIVLTSLLIAIPARAQIDRDVHWNAAGYGLRGPVSSVIERQAEYHGLFDLFAARRGSDSWRVLMFDSLGRMLRDERHGPDGSFDATVCYWHGNVAAVRHSDGTRLRYSTLVIDDDGRMRHRFTDDDDPRSLGAESFDDERGEYRYFTYSDSAAVDSVRGIVLPGMKEREGDMWLIDGRSSDADGWLYNWACMRWDTTAAIWTGELRDGHGRLVESFQHPVFGCWGSSSSYIRYRYNGSGDLVVVDGEYWGERDVAEYDYRYDDRGNWTRMIASNVEHVWFLPLSIPTTKWTRSIEYHFPPR